LEQHLREVSSFYELLVFNKAKMDNKSLGLSSIAMTKLQRLTYRYKDVDV